VLVLRGLRADKGGRDLGDIRAVRDGRGYKAVKVRRVWGDCRDIRGGKG